MQDKRGLKGVKNRRLKVPSTVARENSQRVIELFPRYMDKTASKKHTNFLFGHT